MPSERDLDCQTSKTMPCHRFLVTCKREEAVNYLFLFFLNRADSYRCCAYMMSGGEVAYAIRTTVYRVLKEAGVHQKKADDQAPLRVKF